MILSISLLNHFLQAQYTREKTTYGRLHQESLETYLHLSNVDTQYVKDARRNGKLTISQFLLKCDIGGSVRLAIRDTNDIDIIVSLFRPLDFIKDLSIDEKLGDVIKDKVKELVKAAKGKFSETLWNEVHSISQYISKFEIQQYLYYWLYKIESYNILDYRPIDYSVYRKAYIDIVDEIIRKTDQISK